MGEQVENTFFYEKLTLPTDADLEALVEDISGAVVANWVEEFPADWVGTSVYAKGLTTAIDVQALNGDINGLTGTYPSEGAPGNVTIAIKRLSGLTGRSSRGRIYWQALPMGVLVNNTVSAAAVLRYIDAIEAVDAAAVALGWTPVIVSRQQAGVVLTTGITYPIVTWQVDDVNIDSQRRRLAGRGS